MNRLAFILGYLVILQIITGCYSAEANQSESAWDLLMTGNNRFVIDKPIHPDQNLNRIHELNEGQHPFAVVVSCSDSRVPPELIFDQGLGDLFVIRNAGNLIGDYELGSVEYAVEHLKSGLVVVLGHENCGAVKAYLDHKEDSLPNHIQSIVDYIKAEPEEQELSGEIEDYYTEAIKANILHGVHVLQSSHPVINENIESGKLKIVGAYYHLDSGKVEKIYPDGDLNR